MKTKIQILILVLSFNTIKAQTSLNFSSTNYSVGSGAGPRSIAIGDFNNDGKKDLAVANIFTNNIYILLGNGTGGFSAGTAIDLDYQPFFIVADDFNADGKLDIAVTLTNDDKVAILNGNGNGTFLSSINLINISFPQEITSSDYNGDGKKDLAVAASDIFLTNGEVYLLLANNSGGFSAATQYATSNDPYNIIACDLNGDSIKDVAVGSNTSATNNIVFLMGDGQGNLGTAITYAGGDDQNFCFTSGDFNLDNKLDLIAAYSNTDNLALMTGNGNGNFSTPTLFSTGTGSKPFSVTTADLNSDGKPDLISANYSTNNISVLLGNGSGNFGSVNNFKVGTAPFYIGSDDFNADGKPDLVTANSLSDDITVLINTTGVGIENTHYLNQFIDVFPSLVSDDVNLHLGSPLKNVTVRFTDVTGKLILEKANLTGDSFIFDLSDKRAGIYFIQIYTNSELINTSKIFKME